MIELDSHRFRKVMGCFATGVAVATLDDSTLGKAGITINSLTSVSLEPALLLFCLDKNAQMHPAFRRAEDIVINLLAEGQEGVSRYFAGTCRHVEPKGLWQSSAALPVLRGTLGWLHCRPHKIYQGGDHDIFLCDVLAVHQSPRRRKPLLYFHGKYGQLA